MKLNRILKYAAVSALVVSTGVMTMGCTDNFENLNLNKPIVDVPDFNNPNSIGSLFIKNEPF